jgi:hypothetical protein
MNVTQHTDTQPKSATDRTSTNAPRDGSPKHRDQLRTMSYEQQVQMLTPDGGSPKGGGDKGLSPGMDYCFGKASGATGNPQDNVSAQITDTRVATDPTSRIPAYHVIMEQLAHRYAYHGKFAEEADDIPGADPAHKQVAESLALRELHYEKKDVVIGKETSFQATLFVPIPKGAQLPDGTKLRPVVAFRGSEQLLDFLDDANPEGVGAWQFALHEEQIRGLCLGATAFGMGPPDVTGHSLGGALAQRCAAAFPGLVHDIITFQAPGLKKGDTAAVDPKKHKSTHYRVGGDVVSAAGEEMTPGEEFVFDVKGVNDPTQHLNYPLAGVNQGRRNKGLPNVAGVSADASEIPIGTKHQASATTPKQTAVTGGMGSGTAEKARVAAGRALGAPETMEQTTLCTRRAKGGIDRAIAAGMTRDKALAEARRVVDGHRYTKTLSHAGGGIAGALKPGTAESGLPDNERALIMVEVERYYDRCAGPAKR